MIRLFFLAVIMSCVAVFSQPSPADDPFDTLAFDASVASSTQIDKKNQLEYLPGLFFVGEGTLGSSTDNGNYGADARMYGKAYLKASKADIGALYVGFNFNYFLFAAADNDYYKQFYRVQSPNPKKIYSSLSELHFSFDIKKAVFIRVGSQLIRWGSTYFWSPEDFINLQKSVSASMSVVDSRSGKPGIRVHVPVGSSNLFLFTDFSSLVTNGTPAALEDSVGFAFRLDGTKSGINFGAVGYMHKNRPIQLGFDATGAFVGADLYSELALTLPIDESAQTNCAISAGGARSFGQEKTNTLRLEAYYNARGFGDAAFSSYTRGTFTPLYSGRWYGYAEVATTKLVSSRLGGSWSAYANLVDGSYATTVQCNVDIPGVVPFSVYGKYFGGKHDRELTSLYNGPSLLGGLRIVAEF